MPRSSRGLAPWSFCCEGGSGSKYCTSTATVPKTARLLVGACCSFLLALRGERLIPKHSGRPAPRDDLVGSHLISNHLVPSGQAWSDLDVEGSAPAPRYKKRRYPPLATCLMHACANTYEYMPKQTYAHGGFICDVLCTRTHCRDTGLRLLTKARTTC